ncbi:hypothetical protein FB567DRAFT_525213 [Paraphoma chrysanthemicola]|uniref:Secreted protein n=1 Tax=Paraphoma chrysanthemicola TaxID=798071 RepID=A0A8K0VYT5_9PLEO|nr:hypothetical protein FB567DRAFT_525213 [Paraphoma chrysanthemicola]
MRSSSGRSVILALIFNAFISAKCCAETTCGRLEMLQSMMNKSSKVLIGRTSSDNCVLSPLISPMTDCSRVSSIFVMSSLFASSSKPCRRSFIHGSRTSYIVSRGSNAAWISTLSS